ncbi:MULTISPECIES: CoA-transferase [unclassified Chelatococcus]|uniref:CoA-transferase n=1 Tax=unclassified Chelatococcus TaxID=2638111 RepID=UPI001BCBBA99|nr:MULTISPECIES: CoA-transferase [unclassified Chelatococcus]CAH1651132.1 putative Glutaconate CoA-transferase [Hyphomicrobiales bacterium]MBS7739817.1 hypothetical protein [Chelatococcus sp. HY11]MBX3545461.1 hypothetical protein [Chelatococcus sp.]MCO5078884.1 hypothetical protein [Chelatococcus sp.]CAH1686362.1 putative Glutaconate CoA-transferase [Hyphomicrobiales bacterium]
MTVDPATFADTDAIAARWASFKAQPAGIDRVATLKDAVARHVQAGDTLYFGGSMARPNAAMFEVARQFWSRDPGFTLAAPAIANQHAPLIRAGLVKKVIASIHALTFPTPAPHPLYVQAARDGSVTFESWSLLTLKQRLMAASLGLPFMPTGSLAGSDMARELAATGQVATLDNPFGDGAATVVAPFAPDVTFVHALAADRFGNAIICPPFYDGAWAAFAASRAVIITAERIVGDDFISRYSHQVQIPGHCVAAVCEVPLGGHPNSLPGDAVPEVPGYPDDYAFLEDLRNAGKSPEALDRWSREWILDCDSHEAYLAKLGADRLHALRGRRAKDGWRLEWPELAGPAAARASSDNERHAVLAARILRERLRSGDLSCILAGLGISSLAAWMASLLERRDGHNVPLMVEAGMFGYVPSPADPFLFNYRNMSGGLMETDALTTLGVLTGGPRNRAVGVLGAAQVDRAGNLNTSKLPDFMLTGSGGANDIGSAASEVLVTMAHSPKRLVEAVHFITTPGRAVRTIVTELGVLERRAGNEEFVLSRVLARDGHSKADLVAMAIAKTGWALAVADDVQLEPAPDAEEISLARQLDPKGLFLG